MNTQKPIASVSLDLDNKWSYLKIHGDAGWDTFPSYLDIVVPRVLDILAIRHLSFTVFVVGQDAALDKNQDLLRALATAGHEIGNHSFHHESWMHLYSEQQIKEEITRSGEQIERTTGQRPRGFRGPGFSVSAAILRALATQGYFYDASTFPTFLGPLARAYYFMTTQLTAEEKQKRKALFGHFRDGLRSLKPYWWHLPTGDLIEIPVTTLPGIKVPIHVSYILYLSAISSNWALRYFRAAMSLCRVTGTPLSLLFHPLDFLGCEDVSDLSFFPAMGLPREKKLAVVNAVLDMVSSQFRLLPVGEHAQIVSQDARLPLVSSY
ncbi:MAG: polysaccharide deacetylase family protein [Candidatus Binatia bacterium]